MKGLIHLYCGDGKGKTTSAMGLALRASTSGKKVVIVQFLKDGTSNEIKALKKLDNITVLTQNVCKEFSWNMTDEQKLKTLKLHNENLERAIAQNPDVLILDEVCDVCSLGLLDTKLVMELVYNKPYKLELVMTGRNPQKFMIESADYITEMKKIKHPFEKGIVARDGIEF